MPDFLGNAPYEGCLNIDVFTDLPVMSFPPEADIVIIRRKEDTWSSEQRKYLPDGIRDTDAHYVIIEFKYTESVNLNALKQTLTYDYLFQSQKELDPKDVQTFLVSSKTPNNAFMVTMGYVVSGQNGIYHSNNIAFKSIKLMVLNQLPNKDHNVFFKCFASRKVEKQKAFQKIKQHGLNKFARSVQWLLHGLWQIWFNYQGGEKMEYQMTPEQIQKMGEMWGDDYLAGLPPQRLLQFIPVHERLKDIPFNERLKDVPMHERLKDVPMHERLKDVPIQEVIKVIHELMKRLPSEEAQAYYKSLASFNKG